MVHVEVVYVGEDLTCIQIPLTLQDATTVARVLEISNIHTLYPATKDLSYGIFSKPVELNTLVKDGDRIEIYRPLTVCPKEKRRVKARSLKKRG